MYPPLLQISISISRDKRGKSCRHIYSTLGERTEAIVRNPLTLYLPFGRHRHKTLPGMACRVFTTVDQKGHSMEGVGADVLSLSSYPARSHQAPPHPHLHLPSSSSDCTNALIDLFRKILMLSFYLLVLFRSVCSFAQN